MGRSPRPHLPERPLPPSAGGRTPLRASIGLKIGLAVLVFVLVLLIVQTVLNDPRGLVIQQKRLEATRLASMMVSILSKEMTENEPWRVQEHMSLAESPGDVHNIRVIDQSSMVRYALNAEAVGHQFEREQETPCRLCHAGGGGDVPDDILWMNSDGQQIFSFNYNVRNEGRCQECHEDRQELLGKVLIDLEITKPDLEALSMNRRLTASGLILATLTILGVLLIAQVLVARPLRQLAAATRQIERGNFRPRFPRRRGDEIGELTLAFQRMAIRLGDLISGQERVIEERTEELRRSQQQMIHQEKMAAMGRLTAGVAHEIGNPLASISAMVQLIERTTDEGDTRERAQELGTHIQRITRIVRELVELYRPGRQKGDWVEITNTIETAFKIAHYDRSLRAIDVQIEVADGCPRIYLVEDHLLQILLNLIFNAADAMPEGGQLRLQARGENDGVMIELSDTGSGISAEDLEQVLDPFFTTKKEGKGSGLGLWMSWSLARRWGGELSLSSELGEGTIVGLWLPCRMESDSEGTDHDG